MEILNQLGSLILGSVPTMILFLVLLTAYSFLVRRPLERTVAERRLRTTGAIEQARGAISAAEAETSVYEDKLRAARQQILADRERRIRARQDERDRALVSAREQAGERVRAGKAEIQASAEAARQQIEGVVSELGDRIVSTLLRGSTGVSEVHQ